MPVAPPPVLERFGRRTLVDERVGHGDGAYGVVRIEGAGVKEWVEGFGAMIVELVYRADDIANDGSQHDVMSFGWVERLSHEPTACLASLSAPRRLAE